MTPKRARPGFPRGAIARPIAILVVGTIASVALWSALLRLDGTRRGPERLTSDDRVALERLLRHR